MVGGGVQALGAKKMNETLGSGTGYAGEILFSVVVWEKITTTHPLLFGPNIIKSFAAMHPTCIGLEGCPTCDQDAEIQNARIARVGNLEFCSFR